MSSFERVYVLNARGQRYGPASRSDVAGWVALGRVEVDSWLEDQTSGQKRPISDFPDLVEAFPRSLADKLFPRNGKALFSYYIGVFSVVGLLLLCLPGGVMGLAAVVLGAMSLGDLRANPLIHGKAHAVTGIVTGAFSVLVCAGGLILFLLHR